MIQMFKVCKYSVCNEIAFVSQLNLIHTQWVWLVSEEAMHFEQYGLDWLNSWWCRYLYRSHWSHSDLGLDLWGFSTVPFLQYSTLLNNTLLALFTFPLGVLPGTHHDFSYLLWPGSNGAELILKCDLNSLTDTNWSECRLHARESTWPLWSSHLWMLFVYSLSNKILQTVN